MKLIQYGWKGTEQLRPPDYGPTSLQKVMLKSLHISIPSQWANFFTVMLLSPDLFGWAKDFLASKVVTCLGREAGVIDYHVPKQCPK